VHSDLFDDELLGSLVCGVPGDVLVSAASRASARPIAIGTEGLMSWKERRSASNLALIIPNAVQLSPDYRPQVPPPTE
jgi:hypothetical protein